MPAAELFPKVFTLAAIPIPRQERLGARAGGWPLSLRRPTVRAGHSGRRSSRCRPADSGRRRRHNPRYCRSEDTNVSGRRSRAWRHLPFECSPLAGYIARAVPAHPASRNGRLRPQKHPRRRSGSGTREARKRDRRETPPRQVEYRPSNRSPGDTESARTGRPQTAAPVGRATLWQAVESPLADGPCPDSRSPGRDARGLVQAQSAQPGGHWSPCNLQVSMNLEAPSVMKTRHGPCAVTPSGQPRGIGLRGQERGPGTAAALGRVCTWSEERGELNRPEGRPRSSVRPLAPSSREAPATNSSPGSGVSARVSRTVTGWSSAVQALYPRGSSAPGRSICSYAWR
jgi:hypothetical protein